jgi:glutamyl-tRNA synthetase
LNGVYIRQMPVDELAERLYPVLQSAGLDVYPEVVLAVTPLIQERIKTLNDAIQLTDFIFEDEISYETESLIGKRMDAPSSLSALVSATEALAGLAPFDEDHIESTLRTLASDLSLKAGQLFGIIRVAISGKAVAPPLFGTLAVLGRERSLARMTGAQRKLEAYIGAASPS